MRTAWATATAGTPLASEGVPAGSLPIRTRLGPTDKASGGDAGFALVPGPDAPVDFQVALG